ncbi:MAG: class I SAM-dependent methyltransferase [Dehalococcoidia bacterium]
MLQEHLSQAHDRASRRFETIGQHVDWIHHQLLISKPANILDLGCGPGLYTSRLAQRGHECVGIDYAPASIDYAQDEARKLKLRCNYACEDMRIADYGTGFDLVMLINGELNSFRPTDAKAILTKARHALRDDGRLLLEVHTPEAIKAVGRRSPLWFSAERSIFSDTPHLWLEEHTWHAEANASTTRYFIIDAATGSVSTYAATKQAYSEAEYRALISDCQFTEIEFLPSLTGTENAQSDMVAIVARKPGTA